MRISTGPTASVAAGHWVEVVTEVTPVDPCTGAEYVGLSPIALPTGSAVNLACAGLKQRTRPPRPDHQLQTRIGYAEHPLERETAFDAIALPGDVGLGLRLG